MTYSSVMYTRSWSSYSSRMYSSVMYPGAGAVAPLWRMDLLEQNTFQHSLQTRRRPSRKSFLIQGGINYFKVGQSLSRWDNFIHDGTIYFKVGQSFKVGQFMMEQYISKWDNLSRWDNSWWNKIYFKVGQSFKVGQFLSRCEHFF